MTNEMRKTHIGSIQGDFDRIIETAGMQDDEFVALIKHMCEKFVSYSNTDAGDYANSEMKKVAQIAENLIVH